MTPLGAKLADDIVAIRVEDDPINFIFPPSVETAEATPEAINTDPPTDPSPPRIEISPPRSDPRPATREIEPAEE